SSYSMAVVNLSETPTRPRSFWQDVLKYVLRDRLTMLALGILLVLTLACVMGPPLVERIYKVDPNRTNVSERYLSPGGAHPLGTDNYGRDQLIRLLYGGRI